MPGTERAEIYFISAMMFLIVVLCVVAVWLFFKTYKKEMREKEARRRQKLDFEIDQEEAEPAQPTETDK